MSVVLWQNTEMPGLKVCCKRSTNTGRYGRGTPRLKLYTIVDVIYGGGGGGVAVVWCFRLLESLFLLLVSLFLAKVLLTLLL